jgi:hypothetical protein
MKIAIQLAMMIRMVKTVVVEVPDNYVEENESLGPLMTKVYEEDEGEDFEVDDMWGAEEGTHALVKLNAEGSPDYRLVAEAAYVDEGGKVEKVPLVNRETIVTGPKPLCGMCGEAQFGTPSGITCCNGHGGAPTVFEWPPLVVLVPKKEDGK